MDATIEKARIEYHATEALIHVAVAYYAVGYPSPTGKKLGEAMAALKMALSLLNSAS